MHEQDKRLHAVICHVAHNKTSPAAGAVQGTKGTVRAASQSVFVLAPAFLQGSAAM